MINSPFNYTGSKYNILDQIIPYFDDNKDNFIDLFCGGGSVWINIINKYNNIIINDIIEDLILIQKELFYNPDDFLKKSKKLIIDKNNKEEFLRLRKSYNEEKSPEKLLNLMLSCTNNMLRFNKKHEFNQTFGKRTWNKNTNKKLQLLINHLNEFKNKKIKFLSKNFFEIEPDKNSMVYIDPPYIESEAGYNNYWSKNLENKLFEYILKLNENNISFALSGLWGEHKNGKRSEMIDYFINNNFNYKIIDYNYEKVAKNKNVKNSKEVLIFNYKK